MFFLLNILTYTLKPTQNDLIHAEVATITHGMDRRDLPQKSQIHKKFNKCFQDQILLWLKSLIICKENVCVFL